MNETVKIAVAAADTARPPNVTRWTGQFATVSDTVIPTIRWVRPPPVLGQGGTVLAEVVLPSDRELVSAQLVVRPAGTNQVETLVGQIRERQIEVDMPPALSPASGLFYRWIIQTNRRTYEWPSDVLRPWRSWTFTVSGDASFWPKSGSRSPGRTLLASPIIPDEGDALAPLRSDLAHNPGRARLYGFDAATQKWVTEEDIGAVGLGQAVLMVWDEAAPVVQIGPGHTTALDSAQEVTLRPRWNLVGQPFPYPISWSRVLAANPDLPVSGPWVERQELRLGEVWDAWEGAWLYLASSRPAKLVIPAGDTALANGPEALERARSAIPLWLGRPGYGQSETRSLLVISARSEKRSVSDLALGWHVRASDAYDRLDIPAPPSPDSALMVRFPHSEWAQTPGNYAVDIRQPSNGSVWRLALDTDGSSPVTLRFDFIVPPPGMSADLIDLMTQDSLRLNPSTTTTYTLRELSRFPAREMAIVIGDNSFRESLQRDEELAPSKLHLYQNYPNPFNNETTITYSIPAEGQDEGVRPERARLVIYNMLGQQVRVLYDGPVSAGVHTVTWNARDDQGGWLSSGLYFCELTWGSQRRLQRLIYLR